MIYTKRDSKVDISSASKPWGSKIANDPILILKWITILFAFFFLSMTGLNAEIHHYDIFFMDESSEVFEQEVSFIYDDEGELLDVEYRDSNIENNPQTCWEWMQEISFSMANTLSALKKSYSNSIQNEWNQILERFISESYLQFSGFYPADPVTSGSTYYGEEFHDKIRVTLINGILNLRTDMDTLLKKFSQSHGNIPIHYVFRSTEGWTQDMITSGLSKVGFTSIYAQLLAEKWKRLIEEMGGIDQGGKIIHYAHSIGATDTYIARNLLSPEERKMVHVITLGSPSLIPKDSGFGSAINYVSRRDGVCFLDPIGYIQGYYYEEIEFIGTLWGIPFIDHTLYTESYGLTIDDLGLKFIQAHAHY